LKQLLIFRQIVRELCKLNRKYISEPKENGKDDQRKKQHADAGGDRFREPNAVKPFCKRFDDPEDEKGEKYRRRKIV